MTIYFMQLGEGGPIKIGFASTDMGVYTRRSDLQIAVPEEIKILGIADGSKATEAELHRKFGHLRIRGELFRPEAELMDHARGLSEPPLRVIKQAGRPQINEEQTPARFPKGTLKRIDAVLDPETNEKRADFLREAVERELKRRERRG